MLQSVSNSNSAGRDDKQSQEVLFLIFKYLTSLTGFDETTETFRKQLDSSGSLGKVYHWDGEIHRASVNDIDKMFNNIDEQHLSNILRQLVVKSDDSSSRTQSLLAPIDNLFPQTNGRSLENQLSILQTLWQNCCELKYKRSQMIQRKKILSCVVNLEDDSTETWEGNNTLKSIGQAHEYQHLSSQILAIEEDLENIASERKQLLGVVCKQGCLISDAWKGKTSSMNSWLFNRSLGISGTSQRFRKGLSNGLDPSAYKSLKTITTKFQTLWTINGHMLNPAYCVVFDRTGEYIITGADDFLVKVWNIRLGLLVHTLKGHQGYITLVDVSPDNSIIASACTVGTIRLWNMRDGRCLKVLNHGSLIHWIKFDEITFALASAGDNGTCIVWDLAKILNDQCYGVDPAYDNLSMIQCITNEEKITKKCSHVNGVSPDSSFEMHTTSNYNDSEAMEGSESIVYRRNSLIKFPGLFSWSNSSKGGDQSGKLVLSHLQDSLQVAGSNEVIKIQCLDISPIGDVLVTGCEDGIARVWRFVDVDENERRTRSNLTAAEIALSSIKGLLPQQDYERMEFTASRLLQRLEGHVSCITDIKFSHFGDRIVTGSLNDGTVRIWAFNRNYSKNEHVVLVLKDDDSIENVNISHLSGSRRASRKPLKTEAFNVAWTCDDTNVITLQSVVTSSAQTLSSSSSKESLQPTRLKVWDSFTGDLLRTIAFVGQVACKLLSTHPIQPNVVVTCGDDGMVNFWNTENESLICSHRVVDLDSITPSHLVDASFSPDGQYFAVTDMIGRLTLLGLEKSFDRFFYYDQYFSSDYSDFVLDPEGNAVDTGTQLPMHLAPRGLLCRIDGYAYDTQPPLLQGPQPFTIEKIKQILEEKKNEKEQVRQVMDQTILIFQKNRQRNRQTRHLSWASMFTQADVECKSRPKSTHSRVRSNIYNFDDDEDRAMAERVVRYLSSDDSSDDSDVYTRRYQENSNLRRSNRSRHPNRLQSSQNVSLNESTRESRAERRAERREMVRRRFVVESDSDDNSSPDGYAHTITDSDASDNESLGEFGTNTRRSLRRTNQQRKQSSRQKGRSIMRVSISDENSRNTRETRRKTKQVCASPDVGWGVLHRGKKTIAHDAVVDRMWLQEDQTFDSQYCPQLGDHVVYFPQGHIEMLQQFAENTSPPWHSFPRKWPLVECAVKDISYEFPSRSEHRRCQSVLVILTLTVISIPLKPLLSSSGEYHVEFAPQRQTRQSTGEQITFQVTLRNCNLPDFLVPTHIFNRCLKYPWRPGVKVSVIYREPVLVPSNSDGVLEPTHARQEREYFAHVSSLSNASDDWPNSPWESLQIQFESDSIDRSEAPVENIAPWEAVPTLDPSNTYARILARNPRPVVADNISKRILKDIQAAMEAGGAVYEPFAYEVDSQVFPEYYCTIPVPMYVDLICRRLENNYYRQIEALEFDIDQIYTNCVSFNSDGTEIIADAMKLREHLHRIVWGDHDGINQHLETVKASTLSTSSNSNKASETIEENILRIPRRTTRSMVNEEAEFNDEIFDKEITTVKPKLRSSTRSRQTEESSTRNNTDQIEASNEFILRLSNRRAQVEQQAPSSRRTRSRNSVTLGQDSESSLMSVPYSNQRLSNEDHNVSHGMTSRRATRNARNAHEPNLQFQRSTRASMQYALDQDSDSEEGLTQRTLTQSRSLRPSTRSRLRYTEVNSDEDEESIPEAKASTRKSKRFTTNNHSFNPDDEEDDENTFEVVSSSRRSTRNIASRRSVAHQEDESGQDFKRSSERRSARHASSRPSSALDDEYADESVENVTRYSTRNRGLSKNRRDSDSDDNHEDSDDSESDAKSSNQKPISVSQPSRSLRKRALRSSERSDEESDSNIRRSKRSKQSMKYADSEEEEFEDEPVVKPKRSTRLRNTRSNSIDNNSDDASDSDNESLSRTGKAQNSQTFNNRTNVQKKPSSLHTIAVTSTSTDDAKGSKTRIDPEFKRTVLKLLYVMDEADADKVFAEPITDDIVPGYSSVITMPMDLSTIREKFTKRKYETLQDVVNDLELMFDNCLEFNDSRTFFAKEAKRLRNVMLNSLIDIQDS